MNTATHLDAGDWLRKRAQPVRHLLALSAGLGLLGAAGTLAQAGAIAWIVHVLVIGEHAVAETAPAFALLAAAIVLRAAAQWGGQQAGLRAASRVRADLRSRLFDHLARLGPAGLATEHSATLASRLVEQVDALEGYFARFRPQCVLAVGIPLIIAIVVFTRDWLAAALLVAAAPLIPLFMALVGMGAERLNRDQLVLLARMSGHFLDRLRMLSTLRLFGEGPRAVQEVQKVADAYRRRSMRTLRVAFLSSAVLEFFASVAIATVAIYIGFGLLGYIEFGPSPELTLFSGLFILLLAPEFFQPLRTLAQHYHDRAAAMGAAGELAELLAQPVLPESPAQAPESAEVVLAGVSAGYPSRPEVLSEVDLRIAAGTCIAVTGPSGSGKSTLLQVVGGFLAPTAGTVRVGNAPPGAPGHFAWLGQHPLITWGTLAENIALGRGGASEDEIAEAARHAGVMDYAGRLPNGLQTVVGERGYGLSGGQARRLALARVFLSRAPLVLLDEPTQGLDPIAEAAIIDGLRALVASGRTLMVASHHPAVIAMADRVLRLEHGNLGEVIDAQ